MTKTIDLLGTQHRDVLERLAAVEAGGMRPEGADLADFAMYLQQEVAAHFALEEQALFPVLERHLPSEQGPLAVMHAEHASFRELLSGLAGAMRANDPAEQRAHAGEIIALLRGHIAKEDQVLFPMALRLLSDVEQAEVNQRAAAIDDAAHA